MSSSDRPILIKKIKKVAGHGHHGGAWKVAYADFVTAMMAFFLLMWLINTTDPEQKRGIAEYFAPASVSQTTSGSGGILGGTALGDDGAKGSGSMSVINQLAPEAPPDAPQEAGQSSNLAAASEQALRAEIARREAAEFASAAESLRQAMQSMPELAELSKQLIIDQTPEGLRIQLVDQEGRSMFDTNSSRPNPRATLLLRAISRVINQLPNRISITGHTSAAPGSGRASGANDWALPAPTPRAWCFRARASIRTGSIRSRARRAPTPSIRTTRPWPETAASPSCCCARRRSCRRTPACDGRPCEATGLADGAETSPHSRA
jgi:chemotaxis protein MotB